MLVIVTCISSFIRGILKLKGRTQDLSCPVVLLIGLGPSSPKVKMKSMLASCISDEMKY